MITWHNRTIVDFLTPAQVACLQDGSAPVELATALPAALTAMVGGGELLLPPGRYTLSAPVAQTFGNVKFRLIAYGAKIDGRAVAGSVPGDTTLITLGGSRLASSPLGAEVADGAVSLAFAQAFGVEPGDMVLVTSTDLWNPTRSYYYKGELVEVVSVSSGINCAPLFDGYSGATTMLHRLAMPTITVEGLEIEMDANQIALALRYVRNPDVSNCTVRGARYAGIQIAYGFGGGVRKCTVNDGWYVGTGTSYNVALASCQGTTVEFNTLSEARHNVTAGGWEPCRKLTYAYNTCRMHPSEPALMSLDMHGNVELSSIVGNNAEGISVSGIDLTIAGNTVTGDVPNATGINVYQEIDAARYTIANNTVDVTGAGSRGIWVSPTQPGLSTDLVDVAGNTVNSKGPALLLQPRNTASTGCSIGKLRVRGNSLTSDTSQAFLINSTAVAVYEIASLVSDGNEYASLNYDAFTIVAGSLIASTASNADRFYGNRLSGYLAQFAGEDVKLTNPHFQGNTGGAGVSRSVRYINTGSTQCISPTFKDITYKAEIEAGTEYLENGATGTTTAILNPAAARLVNFYAGGGRAIGYSTAAPTAKPWSAGDRIFNQSPSIGQPKSWVCTVSGMPATWVSEGNL